MSKKDINNLEVTFNKVSEKARLAYDVLNGTSGRGGLERDYYLAKKSFDDKPSDKSRAERYNNLKKSYETAAANYKEAQTAKNAARKALNAALGTSQKTKDTQSLVDVYDAAVEKVKKAESLIATRGKDAYDVAVQEAYVAADAVRAAGGKVKPLPAPAAGITRPQPSKTGDASKSTSSMDDVKKLMAGATISTDGTNNIVNVTGSNPASDVGEDITLRKWLYYEPAGAGSMSGARPVPGTESGIRFGDADDIRNAYQTQLLKQYGSKQGLIDKLYAGGYLKTKKIAANQQSKAILGALENAVADYTVKQVDDYKNNGVTEFESMDAFLSSGGDGDGKSRTRTTKTAFVLDDTQATALARKLYQKLQGRNPSEKELKLIIPDIQAWQKKNPQTMTSTDSEDGTFTSSVSKTAGDPEEYLFEKLSQKNETKAHSILGYYDAFKSVIGVQ
jgi:hypothetical protein